MSITNRAKNLEIADFCAIELQGANTIEVIKKINSSDNLDFTVGGWRFIEADSLDKCLVDAWRLAPHIGAKEAMEHCREELAAMMGGAMDIPGLIDDLESFGNTILLDLVARHDEQDVQAFFSAFYNATQYATLLSPHNEVITTDIVDGLFYCVYDNRR